MGLRGNTSERDLLVRLVRALTRFGSCVLVDAADAGRVLGISEAERVGRGHPDGARLDAWLVDEEERYQFLVLDAGSRETPWLLRCLEHADHVLLVADADDSPALQPVEASLNVDGPSDLSTPPVSLVLLHPTERSLPSGTARWLAPRQLAAHHHVRRSRDADVERLARRLAGRGVGLVLGGGGALGAAHLGVFESLLARGVPIDAIGGTSAGGGIGAQIAMGWSIEQIRRANIEAWVNNSPFRVPTLPVMSLCARTAIDDVARSMFGDVQIEDLWTPFFCVSTDLTHGRRRVHTRGHLWLAARATASLPGVLSPVIDDGAVLIDGGVLDNLPVSTMKQFCAGTTIAVDISREVDLPVDYTYDQLPGPVEALWQRVNQGSTGRRLPTIPRVLLRTVTVASRREREQSRSLADLLFEPPLDRFSTSNFVAFDEIREFARRYAAERLEGVDVDALVARGAPASA